MNVNLERYKWEFFRIAKYFIINPQIKMALVIWTYLIFLSCQSQERDGGILGGDEGISKSP